MKARYTGRWPHALGRPALCRGNLDDVIGFVRCTEILSRVLRREPVDLIAMASARLFVPHTVTLMALLQQFGQTHFPVALVVDEFGGVAGLVSRADVTAAIVGDLPVHADAAPSVVTQQGPGQLECWNCASGARPAQELHKT